MRRLGTLVLAFALVAALLSPGHPEARATYTVTRLALISDSYTTGTDEGGQGSSGWPTRAWQLLAASGVAVAPDVSAESGAGYNTRGDQGSTFADLTRGAVTAEDGLVVFFGSRNDQHADPALLTMMVYATLDRARSAAPHARLLIIGPAWPSADPPASILRIRDILRYQAGIANATFVDPIAAGWFVGRPELIGSDGVHPTDAGHQYLADLIAPLIAGQLYA